MGMPRKWVSVTRAFRALALVAAGVLGLPTVALAGHFSLRPISASGTHSIVGTNEIRLFGGDQTVLVEIFLSDWSPHVLRSWQARLDSATYSNGIGANLSPAVLACPNSAFCAGAYEFGSICSSSNCTAGFINHTRPDWVLSESEGCGIGVVKGVGLASFNYIYFASADPGCLSEDDGSVPKYGGGLVLYIPPDAAGTYEIGFNEDPNQSFMATKYGQMLSSTFTRLRIVTMCGSAADCDDGNACTTDVCGQDGHCLNLPALEGTHCGISNATECDAQDTCNGLGACVDRVKPAATVCLVSSDECYEDAVCDGISAECPSNEMCPDGTPCADDVDLCTEGQCLAGECNITIADRCCPISGICFDDNPCTDDWSCGPDGQCDFPPLPDATACDDGSSCTNFDRCEDGICLGIDDCSCGPKDICGDGCCASPGENAPTCPADCSDLEDLAEFLNCYSGEEPIGLDCQSFDLDQDGTVSGIDYVVFLRRNFGESPQGN